jgi:hypothetical protein
MLEFRDLPAVRAAGPTRFNPLPTRTTLSIIPREGGEDHGQENPTLETRQSSVAEEDRFEKAVGQRQKETGIPRLRGQKISHRQIIARAAGRLDQENRPLEAAGPQSRETTQPQDRLEIRQNGRGDPQVRRRLRRHLERLAKGMRRQLAYNDS